MEPDSGKNVQTDNGIYGCNLESICSESDVLLLLFVLLLK